MQCETPCSCALPRYQVALWLHRLDCCWFLELCIANAEASWVQPSAPSRTVFAARGRCRVQIVVASGRCHLHLRVAVWRRLWRRPGPPVGGHTLVVRTLRAELRPEDMWSIVERAPPPTTHFDSVGRLRGIIDSIGVRSIVEWLQVFVTSHQTTSQRRVPFFWCMLLASVLVLHRNFVETAAISSLVLRLILRILSVGSGCQDREGLWGLRSFPCRVCFPKGCGIGWSPRKAKSLERRRGQNRAFFGPNRPKICPIQSRSGRTSVHQCCRSQPKSGCHRVNFDPWMPYRDDPVKLERYSEHRRGTCARMARTNRGEHIVPY